MANLTGYINIAISNADTFPNSIQNDLIIYTSNSSQRILMGTSNGSIAILTCASNMLYTGGYLGVSKSNPAYPLDVNGDLNFSGTLRKGGVPYVGSQWSNNSSNVFLMSSNVGIGKIYPAYSLDVAGDLNFDGILRKGGVPYVGSQWSNNSSNVFLIGSNVGINKIAPAYTLDIAGDLNFDGILRKGGVPYVGSQWSNNSSNVFLMSSNVGINKVNPQATLDIMGTLNVSSNITIGGILTLCNSEIINSNLTVSNNLYAYGATSLSNTLNVSGATTLSNSLSVTGTTMLSNSLYVTGATTLYGITSLSNAVFMSSNLIVVGASIHSGTTSLSNTFNVSGATTLSNSLSVAGASMLYGVTSLSNTLNVSGATTLSNSLYVTGITTHSNNVICWSNVGIGKSNPQTALDVNGVVSISSNLIFGGGLTMQGVQIIGNSGAMLNITSTSVEGFKNTSNNIVIGYSSNNTVSFLGPITGSNNGTYSPSDQGINNFSISGAIIGSVPATSESPFGLGEGSLNFNGTVGNYLTIPNQSLAFNWWLNGGFTVETWVNYNSFVGTSTSTCPGLVGSMYPISPGADSWSFGALTTGLLTFFYWTGANQNITSTVALNLNTWYHIAVSYDGTTIRIFTNGQLSASGVVVGTPITSAGNNNTPFTIGQLNTTSFTKASITNTRVVTGVALYTSNFTPSTTPLGPAPSGTTVFLLRVPQNQGKLLVKQIGGTSTVQAYPPAAMTDNTTNIQNTSYGAGLYVASASSIYSASYYQYYAFDKSSTSLWISTGNMYSATSPYAYIGSVRTVDMLGNSYVGEWIQIQLPVSIILSSYFLSGYTPDSSQTPSTFVVLGSQDGINWTLMNTQIGNTSNAASFTISTTLAFNYYRMVTKNLISNTKIDISEWTLYGTQSSINITPDGQVGIGITNPTQQLEVAGNAIINGNISAGNLGMFRNRIINGDMRINQRGITSLAMPANTGVYTLDRYSTTPFGTSGVCTFTTPTLTTTDAPYQYGFRTSLKNAITTAFGTTTNDAIKIMQIIEENNMQDFNWGQSFGVPITLSFWSRTSGITSLPVTIQSSTYGHSYNANIAVTSNGVWQYNQLTIPAPPTGSIWENSGYGMFLNIGSLSYRNAGLATVTGWIAANQSIGTTSSTPWITTVGNYVEFTGLQLEKGTITTPFEFRPYALELQLCQRYFYQLNIAVNAYTFTAPYWNPNWVCVNIPLPTVMRVVPTLILPNALTIMPSYQQPQQNITDYHIFNFYGNYMFVQMGGASVVGLISGNTYYVMSTTATKMGFNSEL